MKIFSILESERTSREYAENYFESEGEMAGLFALDTKILDSIIAKGKVLDAMMGPGRHVIHLARHGLEVSGNDFNRHMVAITKKQLKKESLKAALTNSDVRALPMKNSSFDYVLAMYNALGSIMGYNHRMKAVSEMARVCRPGGKIILHAHNILGDLSDPVEILALLRAVFFRPKNLSFGDFIVHDRFLKETYQHIFTPGEVRKMFASAGLAIEKVIFLRGYSQSRVAKGPFKLFLSGGMVFVGRKV